MPLAFICAALAQDAGTILTPDGIGEMKIGTSYARLQDILRQKLIYEDEATIFGGCGIAYTRNSQAIGVSFTMDDQQVTRINVDFFGKGARSPVRTAAGIGLDATEAEVKQAYGNRLIVRPYPDDPAWHYLIVDSPDHTRAMVFETNGAKVIHMQAGEYPQILQPDGCR